MDCTAILEAPVLEWHVMSDCLLIQIANFFKKKMGKSQYCSVGWLGCVGRVLGHLDGGCSSRGKVRIYSFVIFSDCLHVQKKKKKPKKTGGGETDATYDDADDERPRSSTGSNHRG